MSFESSDSETLEAKKTETVYSKNQTGTKKAKDLALQQEMKFWEEQMDKMLEEEGMTEEMWLLQGKIQRTKIRLEDAKLNAMYQTQKLQRARNWVNEWKDQLKKLENEMEKLFIQGKEIENK